MVQLARYGRVHPVTEASLRAALFTTGPYTLPRPTETTDEYGDWATDDLTVEPVMRSAEPWSWHGVDRTVTGRVWGGCLEVIDWLLGVGRDVLPNTAYAGSILFVETSEEMPGAETVYRMLRVMGERGLLRQFAGVMVARPMAYSKEHPTDRAALVSAQREAVLRALAEYNPSATVVLGVDAGHTDPQVVIPIGGTATLDPSADSITVTY